MKLKFHKIADRPFVTLEPTFVEIAGAMAFSEPPGVDVKDALVRVKYTARKISEPAIRRDLMMLGAS